MSRACGLLLFLLGCSPTLPENADPATGGQEATAERVETKDDRSRIPELQLGKDIALEDLDGATFPLSASHSGETLVLIFVRTDCPIANRYAPEIKRLATAYDRSHLMLVYADPDETVAQIRAHLEEFGYDLPAFRDTTQGLVRATQAHVTPEAVVFNAQRQLVYRGRIDNRHADFGKARVAPTTRDLADVLAALEQGKTVEPHGTRAVGCYIPGT